MTTTVEGLRVLLIEDDGPVRAALEEYLRAHSFSIESVSSQAMAIGRIRGETTAYDAVLADLMLLEANGAELIRSAQQLSSDTQVITLTSFATLDAAIESIRQGAFDYVTRPFKFAQIEIALERVAQRKKLVLENQKLAERVQSLYSRLDALKDNRDKFDRFMRETSDRLDSHSGRLDDCFNLLQQVLNRGGRAGFP